MSKIEEEHPPLDSTSLLSLGKIKKPHRYIIVKLQKTKKKIKILNVTEEKRRYDLQRSNRKAG